MARAQGLPISHRVPRPHILTSSEFAEVTAKLTLLCLCKPGLGQAAEAHRDTWQMGRW